MGAGTSAGVHPEIVDALYRALLGRPPDVEGARSWTQAASVDDVIRGLTGSSEYRERVIEAAAGFERRSAGWAAARAARLEHSEGEVALAETAAGPAAWSALETLPLAATTADLSAPSALVLGPYGSELARELLRRQLAERTAAGFEGRDGHYDVLVVTDPDYVAVLRHIRPTVLERARLRVVCPVAAADPAALRERIGLHRLGFIEVVSMFRRRHGDAIVTLDISHTTPEPAHPRVRSLSAVDAWTAPEWHWLIANRIPTYDRA